MPAASLVVRVSADINDFSKQMKSMTKGVSDAAKKVGEVGKELSLGLTLPIVALGAEMLKLGMDQEAVANKFQRQFGAAADDVAKSIEQIRAVVPATTTELMKIANQMDQFGKGLGMAGPQAAMFSGEVLKMATNLAAANPGTTLDEATDALMRGFEGATKGLKSYGVNLQAAQVKQEAYRLGVLQVGQDLTPLGTALATYSMLTERMTHIQGEAVNVQQNVGRQFAFLKSDVTELADAFGKRLLPAFAPLITVGRGVVMWFSDLSDGAKDAVIYIGALAASIGPLLIVLTGVALAIVKIKAALDILKGAELIEKIGNLVTGWKAAAIALAAVAVSVIVIAVAWSYFKEKGEEAAAGVKKMIDGLKTAKELMGAGKGSEATSFNPDNPLQAFNKNAGEITSAFDDAVTMGQPLVSLFGKIVDLNTEAVKLLNSQVDKFGEMAQAARKVMIETQALINTRAVASAIFNVNGTTAGARGVINAAAMSPAAVANSVATSRISDENNLRLREATVRTIDTFDALRVATVDLKEKFLQTSHDFHVAIDDIKLQFSSSANFGGSLMAGLEAGATSAIAAFGPMALAAEAVSKVMQGFMPVIDNLMGPLVALGQILAEEVEPLLKPLFQELKVFGIAVAIIGEVVYTVAAGIAHVVGSIIVAIGKLISKIPFLGGIGHDVQDFGNGIINLGKSFSDTAQDLDKSRIDLQNLDFDNAANGLTNLTNAANQTAEAMTNVPQAFKIDLARYQATNPSSFPGASGNSSSGGGAGGGSGTGTDGATANVYLDGKAVGQIVWNRITSSAKRQFGSQDRLTNLVVVG